MPSTSRTSPPYRADHVGSLIRPPELRKARKAWMEGETDRATLTEIEDRCIQDVIKMQERIGLQAVTDGEFRRSSWRDGFFENLDGFSEERAETSFEFNMADGTKRPNREVPSVIAKLKRRNPIAVGEFLFVKEHTTVTPKVTLPAPSVMHFFRGDDIVDPAVYSSIEQYMSDVTAIYREEIGELVKAGCTYLQIDEVALPVMCDPDVRRTIEARGEDPDELIEL